MTRHRILQIGALTPGLDAKLPTLYDVSVLPPEAERQAFLAENGASFEGIATHVRHPLKADLIAALPNAKVVANFGVGYDLIDVAAAKAHGMQVANTPDVLTTCVADIAFGLLIDVARGISATDRFVRAGGWKKGQRPLMTRVGGKRLGIIGLGMIGKAIAKRGEGFDMEVRYNGRRAHADSPYAFEPSLLELARWADFLVVSCVGGAETKHLVSADVINALGPEGFLINIARGSVVDEAALVAALVEKRLGGAGLDVFENEPNVPEPLLAMDNVVLLSHIAGFTRESRVGMEQLVLDNLAAYFAGGKVLTPV
jgi:lactate dehydrogenase-like 2-hydroxyacid dehydrogenase